MRRKRLLLLLVAALAFAPILAAALQTPAPSAASDALNTGDVAWMLTATSMRFFTAGWCPRKT